MKTISIIVLLGIIGGGVWYMQNKKGSTTTTEPMTNETTTDSPLEKKSFTGSLSELAKSGKGYECTFVSTVGGASTNGKVYVHGEKINGTFSTAVPQYGTIESHMISDATKVYTWSSMSNQGFVFPKNNTAQQAQNTGLSGSQNFDMNQNYTYNCVGWTIDPALFIPPPSITFKSN